MGKEEQKESMSKPVAPDNQRSIRWKWVAAGILLILFGLILPYLATWYYSQEQGNYSCTAEPKIPRGPSERNKTSYEKDCKKNLQIIRDTNSSPKFDSNNSSMALINHPEGKYYSKNKDILLRRFVRASTAAPVYFEPETIDVGRGQVGVFVDGGVSIVNNPALMLFLIATLKGFTFHWELGEDKILLVSIGTGTWRLRDKVDAITGAKLWTWAGKVPLMLMFDASLQNQLLLQVFSNTKTRVWIDSEIGDLSEDLLTEKTLLTYLRYNTFLDENGMNELKLVDLIPKLDSLRGTNAGKNRFDLARIGEEAAKRQVLNEHFQACFVV